MSWVDYSDRMDQHVIIKDGTAVDIEYFMATHVPFRDLEFIEFGDTESKAIHLSENQIYDQYIVNKSNKHQMIIVRGTNGTGKSHLICWLHNRLISDTVNYNKDKEKVIFLRRLGNTVRGAVQQMLDEGLVQDKELKEKFEKFCDAAESQSEEEFKTSIYSEYAKRVLTDSTNKEFKQITCKNIAAFLFDSRVQEYMMRPEGPVDKCYQMITSGAKTIVTDETETIFTVEDFAFPRDVANAIKKDAAEEVRSFYLYELRDDDSAIKKLVAYLNHFTSSVMQSCANITSENARDLFVNLRKSLKKEGKNLTIFIEDFTSFSIVESELITALSVENGGKYNDLCRVTSVIGITDGYYDSFRDNFKDRVTKQIKVTEQSYSGDEFILEMAARYLNAIYCTTESVKDWYKGSAVGDTMPTAEFVPEYDWDSVLIGDASYTLYPFNKQSLLTLYGKLKVKTPRNFLFHVIQWFFQKFADGMEYGDDWTFPEMPAFISSVTLQPPYADSVENSSMSDVDKQRLKVLFKIWGDGTTEATDEKVGGISKKFLQDIGLGAFGGVCSGTQKNGNPNNEGNSQNEGNSTTSSSGATTTTSTTTNPPKLSEKEVAFNRKKEDIEAWFEQKKTLEYSSDYNKWVGNFVVQSIAWQDEGFPGDLVTQRLRNGNFVDIEDSKLETNKNTAVVVMKRDSETRTVLMGLTLLDYYKNWDFPNAAYYQYMMITWLEKNKNTFIENLFGKSVGVQEHPIITWCIAIEYLQRLLLGEKLEFKDNEALIRHLMRGKEYTNSDVRANQDWNDVLTFLKNQTSMRTTIKTSLVSASKTIMGVVGEKAEGKVPFFRTSELLNSVKHLRDMNWYIKDELDQVDTKQYESIRKHLLSLYAKISVVIASEKKVAQDTIKEFETLLGKNPTEQSYIEVVTAIQTFYVTCGTANEKYASDLKIKFDNAPSEQAKDAIGLYQILKDSIANENDIDLLKIFSQKPVEELKKIIKSLKDVEAFANKLKETHSKLLGGVDPVDPLIVEGALSKLEELSNKIEEMEHSC